MAFKYKIPRQKHNPAPAYNAQLDPETESLTGLVQGAKASDIEERFARALDHDPRVAGYTFRKPVISARNLPGQLEIDFVVQDGPILRPIQIDGEFAHKGTSKKQSDAIKDIEVDNYMKQWGAQPIKRINGDLLADQRSANRVVRELL